MPTLGELAGLIEAWYPSGTAEEWDRVGLVAGDPDAPVRKVLLAVDPTLEVAREAVAWDAGLLITHHPLLLRGVHSIALDTAKGRTLTTLVRAECALLCAHTNADRAVGGVAEAMADSLGLTDQRPLVPDPGPALDKLTTYVPAGAADAVRTALAAAGAGAMGDYDGCSFSTPGEGRFRPLPGARPTIGSVGAPEVVEEIRIECVLPASRRTSVVAAMRDAHPYEEPAFDVVALRETTPGHTGIGRVGTVEPTTLRDFVRRVADTLPAAAAGIRVSGDPDRWVTTVAVSPGAGDAMFDDVLAAGADVYVTSDLRHHPAGEFLERSGAALVDVAHWAGEWLWLPVVEARLRAELGDTVETRVSTLVTDPWTFRL